MTTIKINSLLELNKLVAETIFKWKDCEIIDVNKAYGEGTPPLLNPEIGVSHKQWFDTRGRLRQRVPNYATDIADAYEVLSLDHHYTSVETYSGGTHEVWITPKDGVPTVATAKTSELAICLAALKTKDIEVEFSYDSN